MYRILTNVLQVVEGGGGRIEDGVDLRVGVRKLFDE